MAFQRGREKTGGKQKGSKNKKTVQWDILGESIMNEHTEKFNTELAKLNDKDFMDMYIKVLEYFKPKQNRTDITTKGEKIIPPSITFFDEDQ